MTEQEIQEILEGCNGKMAYRLFCERDNRFGNVFEMCRQMISCGRQAEEIVDSIIDGLSPEMKAYSKEKPYIRTLLIRATEYAGQRLDTSNAILN